MRRHEPARGLATLTVVMVLFFVMALVAAYANRNLLVEQRVATNSYRAERAMTAAEAGIEWAIALLNRGRVDMACSPSTTASDDTPRDRYIGRSDNGKLAPVKVVGKVLGPSCALANGQLTCACPSAAVPDPVPHAVKSWPLSQPASAFRVVVTDMNLPSVDAGPPGVVMLESQGCGSPGQGNTGCATSDPFRFLPEVDGFGTVRVFLGLLQALPQVPTAALTAGGRIDSADQLTVTNTDSATGLTVRAGSAIAASNTRLAGPAGSGASGLLSGDSGLAALVPSAADRFTANDRLFRATFGLDAAHYRRQPAVVRVACGGNPCTTADLQTAAARYPGLVYWFDGDLRLDTGGGTLGSSTHPLLVIVTGELGVGTSLDLAGFFYAHRVQWTGGAGGAKLRGALMAVEDFQADVPVTVAYDAELMQTLRLYYGSFVRVPASWSRP